MQIIFFYRIAATIESEACLWYDKTSLYVTLQFALTFTKGTISPSLQESTGVIRLSGLWLENSKPQTSLFALG